MITFDNIIKDKEYRERVIKYFRLPMRLSVSEEKFISDLEFIKKIDESKYNQVVKLTEADFNKIANEQNKNNVDITNKENRIDFTMENVLEPLLNEFENSKGWKEFIKINYEYKVKQDDSVVTNVHGFYVKENNNKCFLSVDLKSANWQSLQTIIGFKDSYRDMIVKYTDNLIPPISKTFRTKITGILGAKNIMYYNKYLLQENKKIILETIFNETNIDLRQHLIKAFYADEFLIEIDNDTKNKLQSLNLSKLEGSVLEKTGVAVHLVPFKLKWLNIDKSCAKIYKSNYEILNISKDLLLLINKIVNNVNPDYNVDFEKVKTGKLTKKEFVNDIRIKIEDLEEVFNNGNIK